MVLGTVITLEVTDTTFVNWVMSKLAVVIAGGELPLTVMHAKGV